jgi:potassium-transporting ATPase KdpC subunit
MKIILAALRPALVSIVVFTGLLGLAYPALVGILGRPIPHPPPQDLVGRPVEAPAYFWSRPSALSPYSAMTSSGTNAGPSAFVDDRGTLGPNPALVDAVKDRIAALRGADPDAPARVPADLVTASASGLDPHISPEAAYFQVTRVARARGVTVDRVRALVEDHVEERTLGLLGEPRVNVVRLNRDLDAALGPTP